jgi:hypothetical protein
MLVACKYDFVRSGLGGVPLLGVDASSSPQFQAVTRTVEQITDNDKYNQSLAER